MSDEAPKNKGGRPRKDMTKTPEFDAAVKSAVAAALPAIVSALMQARGPEGGALSASDATFAQQLAASIAELTEQGSNAPKKLSPQETTRRSEGRTLLIDLIAKVQSGTLPVPSYRVIAKTFLTDFVIEPFRTDPASKNVSPVEIDWNGVPNEALLPLNDSANQVFAAFMQCIGGPTALTQNADSRAISVTPGGLVIRGLNASAHREVTTMPDGSGTDLRGIRGQNDPRAKTVNVLGTIAQPAVANGATKFAGELNVHG